MADIPARAPAIVLNGFGGIDVMALADVEVPAPGPGEVLIRVRAAGVNRADTVQRVGHYPPPRGSSDIMGLECAGEVAALGEGVRGFSIGDPVCALLAGGGYATYCAVPVQQVLPVPKGPDGNLLSMTEAAAFPEVFCTVWTNVFDRGALKRGERFLVHGGSSGIGTAAIMLAAARGAEVYATAGSAEKCRVCEDLGAKRAINYKDENFVAVIKEETNGPEKGGEGVDVILDMVGGDYLPRDLDILRLEGRHVSIATLQSPRAEINILQIMLKRLTVTGSTLRARTPDQKGAVVAAVKEHVWPLIEAGTIKPVIDSTFPLADAAQAHTLIEGSTHIGKIILEVN